MLKEGDRVAPKVGRESEGGRKAQGTDPKGEQQGELRGKGEARGGMEKGGKEVEDCDGAGQLAQRKVDKA